MRRNELAMRRKNTKIVVSLRGTKNTFIAELVGEEQKNFARNWNNQTS